ncbi:hypothetical protein D4764_13G0012540 [Takifugu flavidus]|uniref:Uncharacterized protein n=1 Tax=Takifugu flavidus TaxID=433684 RepID=A0A5C6PA18_9TELE|nr:hypothetical protein D4764_13G0012540 [Takifugu flavidus]
MERRGEERRGEERRGEERHRNTYKNTLFMQAAGRVENGDGEKQKNYARISITSLLDEEEERRGEETMTQTEACQVIMFPDPGSLGL